MRSSTSLPVAIDGTGFRPIPLDVAVDMHLDHLVGCEKAVADALLQRVGVNRIAEIVDVRDVARLLRRRGQADLRRAAEILEDLSPGRILGGAASMALVDNDQVEEARREFPEKLLALLRPCDRLVEAEIDLISRVDAAPAVDRGGKR